MFELETVTIDTPAGPVRINATDFDAAKHTLAKGETKPEDAAPPAPPIVTDPNAQTIPVPLPAPVIVPPAPPAPPVGKTPKGNVAKVGRKWQIVDTAGNKVADTEDDYHNEDAAKAANVA